MARKTFEVESLKNRVNVALRNTPEDDTDGRRALAWVLETVLMDTDNYHGYAYVDDEGNRVDVEKVTSGEYDPTRRRYY